MCSKMFAEYSDYFHEYSYEGSLNILMRSMNILMRSVAYCNEDLLKFPTSGMYILMAVCCICNEWHEYSNDGLLNIRAILRSFLMKSQLLFRFIIYDHVIECLRIRKRCMYDVFVYKTPF